MNIALTKNVSNVVSKPNVMRQKSRKGYALKMIKAIGVQGYFCTVSLYIKVSIVVESTLFTE